MAISTSNNHSSSSSNRHESYHSNTAGENVRASCYAVNARSTALQGFHYSTTGAQGGMPSPPQSPPLVARHTSAASKYASNNLGNGRARGGAAYTITGECERLFCETLRAVFLGEGTTSRQDSLVTGMQKTPRNNQVDISDYGVHVCRYPGNSTADLPSPEMDVGQCRGQDGTVETWIEVWDYVGGNRFRGFVVDGNGEKAMFVFFDQSIIGGDLKAGLMALLELCDTPYFSCSRLVTCLDRRTDTDAISAVTKDLGWIGFQLTTLVDFTQAEDITSDQWLFMDMDV